jgi:Ser/Thr protein kinase RdoA (MazF antagonist)
MSSFFPASYSTLSPGALADLDVHFGRLTREAARQAFNTFLTAYREIRPLSDAETAAIPWLTLGWWCFYMDFHSTHDQFYPLVQRSQLKARTAIIRLLIEPLYKL